MRREVRQVLKSVHDMERLTGRIATDPSYASGSGVYDLARWRYHPELIEASGLPYRLNPMGTVSVRSLRSQDAARYAGGFPFCLR